MTRALNLDFAFFSELHRFYREKRGTIRRNYRDMTKRFLDHNDPENAGAFLRTPQFEALEMYVFLKEYLDNAKLHEVFRDWADSRDRFEGRNPYVKGLFEEKEAYEPVFDQLKAFERAYPNYIFALTMGTGKTILMATCIFYEFLLANKFPKDPRYCHNALVFAPDKTVLQSLREIQTFDLRKVVPAEYASFLATHLQFHYLDEAGTSLNTLDGSRFNLIVSNTQKVILKRQNKEKAPSDRLFESGKPTYQASTVWSENEDLYGFDQDESALTTNQRFEKLRRLPQLGVYIDEAHHAFGTNLAKDMGAEKKPSSLRLTVDELAASLEASSSHVVACYNYTGTPYVGQRVLPEVVYAYGLNEAIRRSYLKQVVINSYSNTKTQEFVQVAVDDFVKHIAGLEPEGMLPKIAFFAATIDEVQKELRPAVEKAIAKHGLDPNRILVNVGDEKITSNDDLREFNRLDTPGSQKQFILLVNKGREGWNCRSLFGVALFRKPKSRVFVLQATMRCLRSVGDVQHTGRVYLSQENYGILEDELQENFRVSVQEMQNTGGEKTRYQVRVMPPPVKLKLKRVRRLFNMREKSLEEGLDLELRKADRDRYRLIHSEQRGLAPGARGVFKADLSHLREQRPFSALTLVAEVARYLNRSPLQIEEVLESTKEGMGGILEAVNEFNELLYDWVVPRLFHALYEVRTYEDHEEYEVDLIKMPVKGEYYQVLAANDMVARRSEVGEMLAERSFHLDTYCFDSKPERELFWELLNSGKVKKLYFTGMLTHGQTDFYVQYIDPDSHTIRSYYPDFLVQKEDGSYVIVEVKGDNKVDDPVVVAKQEFAEKMALASGMTYRVVKGSEVEARTALHQLFS